MRRFLILLFILLAIPAFSWPSSEDGLLRPQGTILGYDAGTGSGVYRPPAVNSAGAFTLSMSGTSTATPVLYSSISQSDVSMTANASYTVSALSGRLFVTIVNIGTETIWVCLNGGAPTVSLGIPVLSNSYWSDNLSPSVVVTYISSATAKATIIQGK